MESDTDVSGREVDGCEEESVISVEPESPLEESLKRFDSSSSMRSKRYLRNSEQSCWVPGVNQGGLETWRNCSGE